jgi:hypothetical protein
MVRVNHNGHARLSNGGHGMEWLSGCPLGGSSIRILYSGGRPAWGISAGFERGQLTLFPGCMDVWAVGKRDD